MGQSRPAKPPVTNMWATLALNQRHVRRWVTERFTLGCLIPTGAQDARAVENSVLDPVITREADLLSVTGWDSSNLRVEWIEEVVESHYVEDTKLDEHGIVQCRPEGVGLATTVELDKTTSVVSLGTSDSKGEVRACFQSRRCDVQRSGHRDG